MQQIKMSTFLPLPAVVDNESIATRVTPEHSITLFQRTLDAIDDEGANKLHASPDAVIAVHSPLNIDSFGASTDRPSPEISELGIIPSVVEFSAQHTTNY